MKRDTSTFIPIQDTVEKLKDNPSYVAAYDALDAEFTLARDLIKARLACGLTQAELAERMKTSQSAIARLESGKAKPSLRSIERFAEAVGATVKIQVVSGC